MAGFYVQFLTILACVLVYVDVYVCADPVRFTQTLQHFTMTTPGGCVHNGQMYAPMSSFNPSPCEHCMCTASGRVACAIADCFFTPCVDAIHDPKKCCPICPNGPNCRAPDGKVIMTNETYQPDPLTTCSCPKRLGFGTPMALCAVMATQIPILQPVDPVVS